MTSAIKDPPAQTDLPEDAKEKYSAGPPSNATPQEKLLWTPTEGEDATKALFPLTRHVRAEIRCDCGTELLVCWQARTGVILGRYSVRCPNCRRSHKTPDQPLRLFRRQGDDWIQVLIE